MIDSIPGGMNGTVTNPATPYPRAAILKNRDSDQLMKIIVKI